MIILHDHKKTALKAAIFDFDGTISTLRYGWESVMAPLMTEYIAGENAAVLPEVRRLVADYIDESTGIQTIHQMKWLNEAVKKYNNVPGAPDDPWFYKEEYNRRLMLEVANRRDDVLSGKVAREQYIIGGASAFLAALKKQGVLLFAASGTDEADVVKESAALGFAEYFESIQGAKPMAEDCSKEAVIRSLIENSGFAGSELLVVGDGKVEIMLGREAGALTLGIASDEERRTGLNPVKEKRLSAAGAHAIVGDFTDLSGILNWI
ncbi:MAG: HAD family hydrolase [Oscillospiraceae bacterium]|jgi:phosphoglycolate phosphatase-like HAD superfamily hydrolase|nr:HAD family hydrolase [Oscillospiraceae bacterium]